MASKRNHFTAVRIITMSMALIAVGMFVLILVNMAWRGLAAIRDVGLPVLFSPKISSNFSGQYVPGQFGLLPAIWGTVQAAVVALVIAFPVSLAMSIIASEFTLGGIGRFLELVLALFSGIPPVVYGLLSIILAKYFMQPKFSGEGLSETFIKGLPGLPPYNAGLLPREQSVFLGGILLSLLIIPFMAPLILDAIRNVSHGMKEASLALGATRWYTLMRVVLPSALTGITAAVSLGILKATGDVIISAGAIGFIKDNGMPIPLWDIFERNAPLTATAAGLINAFQSQGNPMGHEAEVAYFAGLLLLVLAFSILGLSAYLQRRLGRRFSR